MEKQELIDEINEAFVRIPESKRIVENVPGDLERKEIKKAFQGKHWSELKLEFLEPYYHESLFFMTPDAYRYYLPGYMLACLHAEDIGSLMILDSLVFSLDLSFYQLSSNERFYMRMDGFRMNQKTCIKHFLKYFDRYHEVCKTKSSREFWDVIPN